MYKNLEIILKTKSDKVLKRMINIERAICRFTEIHFLITTIVKRLMAHFAEALDKCETI